MTPTDLDSPSAPNRWLEAWPDALAFGAGLAVAWWAGWETTDLVWSLWLSSLVVGYAMILWSIFGPVVFIGREVLGDQTATINGREVALGTGGFLIGALFLLAFFTFHFGMFHYVHSVFLNAFFPVEADESKSMPGLALYWEVFRRYWIFLPMAFLAERQAFRMPGATPAEPPDTSVTAEAIAARKARNAKNVFGGGMMNPYKNVMRMHLLIFFFAAAHFAKLESFIVYAVVYAVYFFPWRLVKREAASS